jgi:hypothetical protein
LNVRDAGAGASVNKYSRLLNVRDAGAGASVNETSASLREEGLVITDAVVLLDREQGGPERIAADGVKLRAALTVTKFIAVLEKLNKLDAATCAKVRDFVAANRFAPTAPEKALPVKTTAHMTYAERAYVSPLALPFVWEGVAVVAHAVRAPCNWEGANEAAMHVILALPCSWCWGAPGECVAGRHLPCRSCSLDPGAPHMSCRRSTRELLTP